MTDISKKIKQRVEIVARLIEKVYPHYPITYWEICGSTAQGNPLPGSDIDLAIQLKYLRDENDGKQKSRIWHEFECWITPILEEFKNQYGVEIDLAW